MSRHNKVNPDHYTMAGRLSADDLARERMRQGEQHPGAGRRGRNKPTPPWMANETPAGRDEARTDRNTSADNAAETEGAGMPRRQAAQKKQSVPAARKGSRPAPRRKATGDAPRAVRRKAKAAGKASGSRKTASARKSPKAAGARATPTTSKAPRARGSAARGASPQRAGRPGARKGRAKGSGTTRKKQKK